jgi:hypothetical protein
LYFGKTQGFGFPFHFTLWITSIYTKTLKEHVRFTFASGGGAYLASGGGAYLASGSWLKLPTISIQGWPRFNGSCCSMGTS